AGLLTYARGGAIMTLTFKKLKMATKKTPARKTSKAKSSSKKAQSVKFGRISKFQLLIFAALFAIVGGTLYLYSSRAAGDTWSAYLSTYPNCNTINGIP